MKKSPLSTPSCSRGMQNYNWKSNDHKSRTGYNYGKSDNSQCVSPNLVQIHTGNDFIPLNISTPQSDKKRHSGNWHGSGGSRNHRNSGSGGFNHYRNNYHATPKSNFNNLYSPYKHSGKQFYCQRKGYQKDARQPVDISRYIDMTSFLEDPWAELVKRLNKSEDANGGKLPKIEESLASQSIYNIASEADSENKSATDVDDSCFSQESRHDSSLDVSLGLDDTDISDLSKTDSSINLKLDSVRFSEESKDESFCNNNDNDCEGSQEENNVHEFCSTNTNSIEAII
ncbi:PREDICTED: uncharacterized protein LOC107186334 [Dufourea novaeangliae]|uniref:Uncharacterized protein n=1 Tax=Dufourea novaeangliae TaxID=178035 RepID=A0A154PA94_DUFNO|nr:PREDICTED: uncharacterized protein LOC107186334 [Dufourea novaeangliae]KZC08110.1 hypothetical protein WN55_10876 [Dufourea novaeangliae]